MFRKLLAATMCAVLATSGCASAAGARVAQAPAPVVDRTVMADYVQRIAPGSRVRVERTSGETLRGTLMAASAASLTVQRNTRIPEPPVEIPLDAVARVSLDNPGGSSTAKAIGIGVAAGVGTFLGILAILASAWND